LGALKSPPPHIINVGLLNKTKTMKRILSSLVVIFSSVILFGQQQIKYTNANLNLRASPSIENNVISTIPKGTTISVDYSKQEYSNWIKITYDGKTGYVFSKYLVSHQQKNNYSYSADNKEKNYTNSAGQKVQSPTHYSSPPSDATAVCRDGTYSFSKNRRGTCSHHGGVNRWL
jgi:uncharacterized protein YgiM (DUF1202 family)